jgi:hypothetical protein
MTSSGRCAVNHTMFGGVWPAAEPGSGYPDTGSAPNS